MSEYTLYDFTESIRGIDLGGARITKVVRAWGQSGDYSEWSGGFVVKLSDKRYAYITGWCDTTGWGCRDGAEIHFAPTLRMLERTALVNDLDKTWDEDPTDLNTWLTSGSPDQDAL